MDKSIHKLIAQGEMDIPSSFVSHLNFTIAQEDSNAKRQPSKFYKPSSLRCIRNMYYQRVGAPQDATCKNPDLVCIAENGTDRHLRLQGYISRMKAMDIPCDWVNVEEYIKSHNLDNKLEIISSNEYETKLFHKDLNVRFMCDGIINYFGRLYILEIKTTRGDSMWGIKKLDSKYIQQALAYSTLLEINDILFLYENRNTCEHKCFLFHATEEMKKRNIIDLINNCEEYVNNQIVPPKPVNINEYQGLCTFCDYKKLCKRDK